MKEERFELKDGDSLAHYRGRNCRASLPVRHLGGPGVYGVTREGDLPRKVRPIHYSEDLLSRKYHHFGDSAKEFFDCECGARFTKGKKICPCCGAEWGEPIEAKEVQKMLEEKR